MSVVQSKIAISQRQTMAILTVAAVGMFPLLALLADTGHDQLWLLLAAERMGHSLNPYGPQVFESNPPLAIWLSAIVVKASALLHLPLTVAFKLSVTLVATASAVVCARLLRRLHPEFSPNKLWLLGIAFVLIFGAIPARDFGQRDHILALLVLPYLIAAPLTLPNIPRLLITLTAALGLALKPHQALIAIAVELTLAVPHLRRGTIATKVGIERSSTAVRILEPTIFLLSAGTYLAAIHLFAPTYLTDILPILRDTYWAFGHLTLIQLASQAIALYPLLALTLCLYLFTERRFPLILTLLVAGIAATLAYIAQGTGWYYQQLPAVSFLAFALLLQSINGKVPVILSGAQSAKSKDPESARPSTKDRRISTVAFLPLALAALAVLALTLTALFSNFQVTPRGIEQIQSTPDPAFFAGLPPNAAVATLTTSVDDTVPPAFRYHLTLAQRYPHLWMFPAILRNESGPPPAHTIAPAKLAELDRLQHRFMVEDFNRWHPALILVARCEDPAIHCQALEDRHDDLLAWFLRDPAFASLFRQYHFDRSSGPYDAYRLN